jgi:hypothetical protein
MARTEYVDLRGKVKWFRYQLPDQWGKWGHCLYLDDASKAAFRELKKSNGNVQGVKTEMKYDDDGDFVILRRPAQKEGRDGKVYGFAPPVVFDGSITLQDGSHPPIGNINIGNGSDVTTRLEVYQYNIPGGNGTKGKACRWLSSVINSLVPYESARNLTPQELKQSQGLIPTPSEEF